MTLNSDVPPAGNRSDTAHRGEIQLTISVQLNARQGDSLTSRQAQLLRGIEYAIANEGAPPTRRQLLSMLGTTSQGCLRQALDALAKKGFLQIDDGVSRGLRVLIPSSEAAIDDSKSPLARTAGPGIAKARPRAGAERKAVGT